MPGKLTKVYSDFSQNALLQKIQKAYK